MERDVGSTAGESMLSFRDEQHKLNSEDDAEQMATTIEITPHIDALELRGNTIGVGAGRRIAKALECHPELKRALWSDLFTGRLKEEIPPILKSLCDAMIKAGTNLVELDLSDNAFGPIGAEGIEKFLESPSAYSLQVLKLNNNGLGAGGKVVARSLIRCCENAKRDGRHFNLKIFIAGRNRLEDPGANALAGAFKMLGSLEEITMHQDGIRSKGIEELVKSFKYNRNLRIINLSDNTFTVTGAQAMAKTLPHLPKLEILNLSDCLCRDKGAQSIINTLNPHIHSSLQEINLSGNELSPDAVESILTTVNGTFQLRSLVLHTNNLGHRFNDMKSRWECANFADFGEESDDQNTLDGDEEDENAELLSDKSSLGNGNESDDEFTEGRNDDIGKTKLHMKNESSQKDHSTNMKGVLSLKSDVLNLEGINLDDADSVAQFCDTIKSRNFTILRLKNAFRKHSKVDTALKMGVLFESLKSSYPKIAELDLSSSNIDRESAQIISHAILRMPSLTVIKLSDNDLKGAFDVIMTGMIRFYSVSRFEHRRTPLNVFEASNCNLQNSDVSALKNALEMCGTLREIVVSDNNLGPNEMTLLAKAFMKNPCLKLIDVSRNPIQAKGISALANVLPNLKLIETLKLNQCSLGDAGAVNVVSSFDPNVNIHLKVLEMFGNDISVSTCEKVIRALASSFHVTKPTKSSDISGTVDDELKHSSPAKEKFGQKSNRDAHSGRESGNEGDDEQTEDADVDATNVKVSNQLTMDDVILFMRKPTTAILHALYSNKEKLIELLQDDLKGRTQEVSFSLLYAFCVLMTIEATCDEKLCSEIVSLSSEIMDAASTSRRKPLSATEQICNQLLASVGVSQAPTGDRAVADISMIIFLLQSLIKKNHFKEMIPTIKYYLLVSFS